MQRQYDILIIILVYSLNIAAVSKCNNMLLTYCTFKIMTK